MKQLSGYLLHQPHDRAGQKAHLQHQGNGIHSGSLCPSHSTGSINWKKKKSDEGTGKENQELLPRVAKTLIQIKVYSCTSTSKNFLLLQVMLSRSLL